MKRWICSIRKRRLINRAVGLSLICLSALLFSVFDASYAKEQIALSDPIVVAHCCPN